MPAHLAAASTSGLQRLHPLLDALAPTNRLHRLQWQLATLWDTIRWAPRGWRHWRTQVMQRAAVTFGGLRDAAPIERYDLLTDDQCPRLLRGIDVFAWKLFGETPPAAPSVSPHHVRGGKLWSQEVAQLGGLAMDAPPLCTAEDLQRLRDAPSWAEARAWAAQRWPVPILARAALVWAARPDQPVWAWRQLFHRAELTRTPPLMPYPGRSRVWPIRRIVAPLGDADRDWQRREGLTPSLFEIPSLAALRVPIEALRAWLAHGEAGSRGRCHFGHPTLAPDGILPGDEPNLRRINRYWHHHAFTPIYLHGPAMDRLMRWVQLSGADLVRVAQGESAPSPTVASHRQQRVQIVLSQIYSRSLCRLMGALRDADGRTPLSPSVETDLTALTGPEARQVPRRAWGWWHSDPPRGTVRPAEGRLVAAIARLSDAPRSARAAWGTLRRLHPQLALRLCAYRATIAPGWDLRPKDLRPLLLAPDPEIRHLAIRVAPTLLRAEAPAVPGEAPPPTGSPDVAAPPAPDRRAPSAPTGILAETRPPEGTSPSSRAPH